jgi:hypothetical protein
MGRLRMGMVQEVSLEKARLEKEKLAMEGKQWDPEDRRKPQSFAMSVRRVKKRWRGGRRRPHGQVKSVRQEMEGGMEAPMP